MQLLGASDIRELAARWQVRPTKARGQNFVVDANTCRRIVRLAEVTPTETVLEVGPGLGSLTLALLAAGTRVTAVEIDPVLAAALPETIADRAPRHTDRLRVVTGDALRITEVAGDPPSALVANLPYNVSVPVVLTLLERFPSITRVLVMVQWEVARRMAATPGTKDYGAPSAKIAWYAAARFVGTVPRRVFWPVPHVESGLVALARRDPPVDQVCRREVFAVIDAAFAQRRKTLRVALADWAGGRDQAEAVLRDAGVDHTIRGEAVPIETFATIAATRRCSTRHKVEE